MDEIYRSQFRMPYALYEQLKASAAANHRSVNAELVARLEASFGATSEISAVDEVHPASPAVTDKVYSISRDELQSLVMEIIDSSIEAATGKKAERRPAIPTKGPEPRGKHPKG